MSRREDDEARYRSDQGRDEPPETPAWVVAATVGLVTFMLGLVAGVVLSLVFLG